MLPIVTISLLVLFERSQGAITNQPRMSAAELLLAMADTPLLDIIQFDNKEKLNDKIDKLNANEVNYLFTPEVLTIDASSLWEEWMLYNQNNPHIRMAISYLEEEMQHPDDFLAFLSEHLNQKNFPDVIFVTLNAAARKEVDLPSGVWMAASHSISFGYAQIPTDFNCDAVYVRGDFVNKWNSREAKKFQIDNNFLVPKPSKERSEATVQTENLLELLKVLSYIKPLISEEKELKKHLLAARINEILDDFPIELDGYFSMLAVYEAISKYFEKRNTEKKGFSLKLSHINHKDDELNDAIDDPDVIVLIGQPQDEAFQSVIYGYVLLGEWLIARKTYRISIAYKVSWAQSHVSEQLWTIDYFKGAPKKLKPLNTSNRHSARSRNSRQSRPHLRNGRLLNSNLCTLFSQTPTQKLKVEREFERKKRHDNLKMQRSHSCQSMVLADIDGMSVDTHASTSTQPKTNPIVKSSTCYEDGRVFTRPKRHAKRISNNYTSSSDNETLDQETKAYHRTKLRKMTEEIHEETIDSANSQKNHDRQKDIETRQESIYVDDTKVIEEVKTSAQDSNDETHQRTSQDALEANKKNTAMPEKSMQVVQPILEAKQEDLLKSGKGDSDDHLVICIAKESQEKQKELDHLANFSTNDAKDSPVRAHEDIQTSIKSIDSCETVNQIEESQPICSSQNLTDEPIQNFVDKTSDKDIIVEDLRQVEQKGTSFRAEEDRSKDEGNNVGSPAPPQNPKIDSKVGGNDDGPGQSQNPKTETMVPLSALFTQPQKNCTQSPGKILNCRFYLAAFLTAITMAVCYYIHKHCKKNAKKKD